MKELVFWKSCCPPYINSGIVVKVLSNGDVCSRVGMKKNYIKKEQIIKITEYEKGIKFQNKINEAYKLYKQRKERRSA